MILSILFYVIAFVLWKKYPCLPYSCWRPQISPTQQHTLQNFSITAHPIHIPCCLTIQATWKCMSISINHAYHSKSNLPRHNITSNSAGIQNTPRWNQNQNIPCQPTTKIFMCYWRSLRVFLRLSLNKYRVTMR